MATKFIHTTLDLQVAAVVMGWHCSEGLLHGRWQSILTDASGNTRSLACGCGEDFNPSINIRDAMEVVTRMRELGCYVTISDNKNEWHVAFTDYANGRYGLQSAAELEEAICHAALMAMET